jgi:hypothetical protein
MTKPVDITDPSITDAGLTPTHHQAAAQALALPPALAPAAFNFRPTTFDSACNLAKLLANSDLVPKDFRNKWENCFVAMQWGNELGLSPLQAVQNIAVINGRPSLWGDAAIALVRASPVCEYVREHEGDATRGVCRVKRRGDPMEQVRTFTIEEAKAAGLLSKDSPWKYYPKRMLQMRARAFALRDVFPDVLKGISIAEEVADYNEGEFQAAMLPARDDLTPRAKDEGSEDEGKDANAVAAPANVVTHLRKKLAAAKIDEAELCKKLGVETLDGITIGHVNETLTKLIPNWGKGE